MNASSRRDIPQRKKIIHSRYGAFLKDAIYGANDGIITTFAVVAGVAGAALSPLIVIILGLANLFADAFSMAASNFLATRSDAGLFEHERKVEEYEIDSVPEREKEEILEILVKKGYDVSDSDALTKLITKNRTFWVDLMMYEELGFAPVANASPWKSSIVTFCAFVIAGFLPLLPYVFSVANNIFFWSVFSTGCTLFLVGSLRTLFTRKNWFFAGFEMFLVGGIAASIAYGVGFLLKQIV